MAHAHNLITPPPRHRLRSVNVATCTQCGSKNYEPGFRMCLYCRQSHALRLNIWREGQRERGLCLDCVERRQRGEYHSGPAHSRGRIYMRCEKHLEYHRAWHAARYARKRAAGRCASGACQTKTRDGAVFCEEHAAAVRERTERARSRQRKAA